LKQYEKHLGARSLRGQDRDWWAAFKQSNAISWVLVVCERLVDHKVNLPLFVAAARGKGLVSLDAVVCRAKELEAKERR